MKELTDREKAAITYAFLNPAVPSPRIYLIAHDSKGSEATIKVHASQWRNSEQVQSYFRDLEAIEDARLREKAAKLEGEMQGNGGVNFADMDEFLNYAQLKANSTTDEKLRLDYLKLISDLRRYKEASKDGDTEIQRFYTPLLCKDCELYKKMAEELKRKK